jgi:alpha-L-rhamnosidase
VIAIRSSFLIWLSLLTSIGCLDTLAQAQLIVENQSPQQVIQIGKGHYFIDFGKAYFGSLQLIASKKQKDSLTIHLGEKALEGSVDRSPGGTIRYQEIRLAGLAKNKTYSLQLVPDNRNTSNLAIQMPDSIEPVMPFRYVEIENLKIPLQKLIINQKAYYYQFNDKASDFNSSDSVLNAVWDLSKHTIKATSFAGLYVDGDRERIPYEADAYINQLSHFVLDTVYSIARRTNEYFLSHPTWPTEWILHQVPLFFHYYEYSGDSLFLRKYYGELKKRTLSMLAREDGLISSHSEELTPEVMKQLGFQNATGRLHDIVDWPPAQKDTGWQLATEEGERDGYELLPINTVVNSFYYHNLMLMSRIAAVLQEHNDAKMYASMASKVQAAIHGKLFDKGRGIYIDGEGSQHASLHANMFPLAFGLVSPEQRENVIDFIESRGMACSVYGAQYLLEGLVSHGAAEQAVNLITNVTGDRNWWHMIEEGATMTWEAWDIRYKPNLDWNHAWGTAPANIISRNLWGIKPLVAGYSQVVIQPQLHMLAFANIRVPTRMGPIEAHYESNEDLLIYEIKLPGNMTGQFIIPEGYELITGTKVSVDLLPGINVLKLVH